MSSSVICRRSAGRNNDAGRAGERRRRAPAFLTSLAAAPTEPRTTAAINRHAAGVPSDRCMDTHSWGQRLRIDLAAAICTSRSRLMLKRRGAGDCNATSSTCSAASWKLTRSWCQSGFRPGIRDTNPGFGHPRTPLLGLRASISTLFTLLQAPLGRPSFVCSTRAKWMSRAPVPNCRPAGAVHRSGCSRHADGGDRAEAGRSTPAGRWRDDDGYWRCRDGHRLTGERPDRRAAGDAAGGAAGHPALGHHHRLPQFDVDAPGADAGHRRGARDRHRQSGPVEDAVLRGSAGQGRQRARGEQGGVRIYGLDLDAIAASAQFETVSIKGNTARVRTTVTVFDAPVTGEVELVLVEGRWYGKHALEEIQIDSDEQSES